MKSHLNESVLVSDRNLVELLVDMEPISAGVMSQYTIMAIRLGFYPFNAEISI